MFEKILVPLDGSELAERALEPALALARRRGGGIILLSVPVYKQVMVPGTAGHGFIVPDNVLDLCRSDAEAYLQKVAQTRGQNGYTIEILVVDGDVAGSIVDAAAGREVDLIAMTTHGYSGFTRWMLGSITERVLRGAPCPVLVIRQVGPLQKILITLDGSSLSEQALEPGLAAARSLGGRVTLLRVHHEEKLSSVEMGLLEVASSELCQELGHDVEDRVTYYLDCVVQHYGSPEMALDTVVVRGQPAQAILDYAAKWPADLIVMATHGRSGLRRWVYGSVTEKVVRNANCAVLVVRPPAEKLR